MAKIQVKGIITYEKRPYSSKPSWGFQGYELMPEHQPYAVKVMDHVIEIEVPDDFNPVAGQVSNLEELKRKKRLKLAEELKGIDEDISKLQCLEFVAAPEKV